MPTENNSKSSIVLWAIALVIVFVGIFVFYKVKNESGTTPTGTDITSGWSTYTDEDEGITFKYPNDIPTSYIHSVDWPPLAQVTDGPFSCTEAGDTKTKAGRTLKKTISEREYCVTEKNEGAAGSIYTQYSYITPKDDKLVTFTFTIQAVQCGNYNDPDKTACTNERAAFNIDPIIDQIIQTAEFL
jgi:hypothetical protein